MPQVVYPHGRVEVVIPATESIAVYTTGAAQVYRVVGYPNFPSTTDLLGTVDNEQTVFGAYATGATIVIEAGAAHAYYEVGAAPMVDLIIDTQVQGDPVAIDGAADLTATAMLGGIVTTSAASNDAPVVPTGTVMDAASEFAINDSFDWSFINLKAANTTTVTADTDHTLVGNMVVAAVSSGKFRTRKTAANTFVTYRIS